MMGLGQGGVAHESEWNKTGNIKGSPKWLHGVGPARMVAAITGSVKQWPRN